MNFLSKNKQSNCQCSKTKDPNGNCDGSHAKKNKSINFFTILLGLILSSSIIFASNNIVNEKKINIKKSNILWKGEKVTGSHEGNISIKSGLLNFDNSKLIGGEFKIDINSIICTDLSGEYKMKLEGHLKSDDFFGVKNYPQASVIITRVVDNGNSNYKCSAKMTIKGITKNIDFVTTVNDSNATTTIVIDRTDFNIKYGSGSFFEGLGDKMIYDDFEITVNLVY